MHPLTLIRREWTKADRLQAQEAPGRPWRRPPGGWIGDFVGLGRALVLCDFCAPKFNPRRNGYEVWRKHLRANGRCDGCNTLAYRPAGAMTMFIPEALHDAVGEYTRPRRGRFAVHTGRLGGLRGSRI